MSFTRPVFALFLAVALAACGGPGGGDGGSGGGGGSCQVGTTANTWSLGNQCWTAGEVKCESRGSKQVMEAVQLTGAFTVWFAQPVAAASTFTIIPFPGTDGGSAIPGATEAQLSLAANIGSGSMEGLVATGGTVTTTMSGGKATASFTNVTMYARDGGVAGQTSGSVTCP